jgi:hypothetical protein
MATLQAKRNGLDQRIQQGFDVQDPSALSNLKASTLSALGRAPLGSAAPSPTTRQPPLSKGGGGTTASGAHKNYSSSSEDDVAQPVQRAAVPNRVPMGQAKPPPQLMASRVGLAHAASRTLFTVVNSNLQNVMQSSSDEDIAVDAKRFTHLPQIVGRNSPASTPALSSPAYSSSPAGHQPLHGPARTPTAQEANRFSAGGSSGSKGSPSFGQQRPTSAVRLASLNHTPTFKQTSPKDDGDDSRFVDGAIFLREVS